MSSVPEVNATTIHNPPPPIQAGFADTFDQLDRRLGDALALGRAAGDASSLAGAAAGAAGSVLAQLTGLLGGRHPGPPPL